MSSTYTPGPIATALLSRLAENWWLLLLRGLAAVAFGIIAFFWPGITLLSLAYLWGAYALADGVLALWAAISGQGDTTSRWWLALSGIVSIIGSGLAFFWPGLTAFVLLMLIAGWAIAIGVMVEGYAMGRSPEELCGEMLRVLAARPGETVPRLTLAGNGGSFGERAVDVQVNRLRRKVEHDPANPLLIQTVRGVGYRLVTTP